MKLLDEEELSKWALRECYNKRETSDIRKLITTSRHCYLYCLHIKDRREIYRKITDSEYAYYYCKEIKDRYIVWLNITNEEWMRLYFTNVYDQKDISYVSNRWNNWLLRKKDLIRARYINKN